MREDIIEDIDGTRDPDGDVTNETAFRTTFKEFSQSKIREYYKYDVTDTGSDTTTLLEVYDYFDQTCYYPTEDWTYTINGNTMTAADEWNTIDYTFSISGTTLTLKSESDNDTPNDTSDDETYVDIFSLASSNDIADAIDNTQP